MQYVTLILEILRALPKLIGAIKDGIKAVNDHAKGKAQDKERERLKKNALRAANKNLKREERMKALKDLERE